MRIVKQVTAALIVSLASLSSQASAAVVLRTFNFTATNFGSSMPGSEPFSVVSGSFSLSFDDAITVLNQSGVTINSLSIPFSGTARFSYFSKGGELAIAGNDVNFSTANTNDFALDIRDANTSSPIGRSFNYSVVGFNDVASTRSVIVSNGSVSPAVPEPATWAMMLFGFGAMGFAMRRKGKVTTNVAFA